MNPLFTPLLAAAEAADRDNHDFLQRLQSYEAIDAELATLPENLLEEAATAMRQMFPVAVIEVFLTKPIMERTDVRVRLNRLCYFYCNLNAARTPHDALIFWTIYVTGHAYTDSSVQGLMQLYRRVDLPAYTTIYVIQLDGIIALARVLCSFFPNSIMRGEPDEFVQGYNDDDRSPSRMQQYLLTRIWTYVALALFQRNLAYEDVLVCFQFLNEHLPYFFVINTNEPMVSPFRDFGPYYMVQENRVVGLSYAGITVLNGPRPPRYNNMPYDSLYAIYLIDPVRFTRLANDLLPRTLNPTIAIIIARGMLTRFPSTISRMRLEVADALSAGPDSIAGRIASYLRQPPVENRVMCSLKYAMDRMLRINQRRDDGAAT